jgi:hypothetical protein
MLLGSEKRCRWGEFNELLCCVVSYGIVITRVYRAQVFDGVCSDGVFSPSFMACFVGACIHALIT